MADAEARLRGEILRFVRESPGNRASGDRERYFDDPLVGFAAASDPIFRRYKEIIGAFHWTPDELFGRTFADPPAAGTVVCWILPVSRRARETNRRETELPSTEWARMRTHGETLNDLLREHVVAFLGNLGHRGVAPMLSKEWKRYESTPVGVASSWSERHAAFAAGLGSFSLSDGLITEKGIAHRCGSVITDLVIPSTPASAAARTDHCLHYRDGSCGVCIERCPAGAITAQGHDKDACARYLHDTIPSKAEGRYDVRILGCGLCQTGVPCEHRIPKGLAR